MNERTANGIPAEAPRQVWLRRWERTVPLLIAPVAAIMPRLFNPAETMLAMAAIGGLIVLAYPGHWSRSYHPAEDTGSFFARELTTGDHLFSLCLWSLAVTLLMIWSPIAPHAPAEANQIVLAVIFLGFGMLLAKSVFPGQTAGLFARAGDERYSTNQAVAVGLALRAGCAAIVVLLVVDLLAASYLTPPPVLVGIAVSTLHATYHGAMWQMERRGEPIEE